MQIHVNDMNDFSKLQKRNIKTDLVAKELLNQKVNFDIIFTSPSKRTKQTLQILNKSLDLKK